MIQLIVKRLEKDDKDLAICVTQYEFEETFSLTQCGIDYDKALNIRKKLTKIFNEIQKSFYMVIKNIQISYQKIIIQFTGLFNWNIVRKYVTAKDLNISDYMITDRKQVKCGQEIIQKFKLVRFNRKHIWGK